jgi:hypothetical protein
MRNDSFAIVWARTTQNRKTGEVGEYDRGEKHVWKGMET